MARRSNRDSVSREPHLNPDACRADPSEENARRKLEREAQRGVESRLDDQGVYDEPDILPGRPGEVVEQDWSCSVCGYNLRGLPVGHRCPECAHIELYRPPPAGAKSYAMRLEQAAARVTPGLSWTIAVAAVLPGGPVRGVRGAGGVNPQRGCGEHGDSHARIRAGDRGGDEDRDRHVGGGAASLAFQAGRADSSRGDRQRGSPSPSSRTSYI